MIPLTRIIAAIASGGPRHVVTSVLDPAEACALLDSIDTSTVVGVRDRAPIGVTQPNAVASDMRTEP